MILIDEQLERARVFLAGIADAAEKAFARAANKAAAAAREAAIAAICERYAVRPSDVREKITTRAASPQNLEAAIVARSGSLSLTAFPHSPTDPGTGGRGKPALRAEVLRGAEKQVGGAFIAPIGGRDRIMMRTSSSAGRSRQGLRSLSTVPIANMLAHESVREAVAERVESAFDANLDREIDRALKGDG